MNMLTILQLSKRQWATAYLTLLCFSGAKAASELLPETIPTISTTAIATPYSRNFDSGVDGDYIAYEALQKWYPISYGGATELSTPTRETPPWTTVSTNKALKLSPGLIPPGGGIQYVLPLGSTLKLGSRYRISMTVGKRAGVELAMRVVLLGQAKYSETPVVRLIKMPSTATSQKVTIDGIFHITNGAASPHDLRIFPLTQNEAIYVDDLKIEEMPTNATNLASDMGFGVATSTSVLPMDEKMFGFHVTELGTHNTWPEMGQTTMRLWGQPTMWFDLEPNQNAWAWQTSYDSLTYHIDYFQRNRTASSNVIYTLGQTPSWASSQPSRQNCSYSYRQTGSCAAPNNPNNDWADWKDYVYQVAKRNLGKIRYFEVWNEPSEARFFTTNIPSESARTLAAMTCAAKEALKAADPNNTYDLKLIGPSSSPYWLDEYIEAGGAACVDIMNIHGYVAPQSIEATLPAELANLKFTMANYKLTNKPIWNTEGAVRCTDGTSFCSAGYIPGDGVLRGSLVRALGLMWANGVTNFDYFFLEGGFESWSGLALRKPANSNCQQTINGCLPYMTLTPVGQGFAKAGSWMKGKQLMSAYANSTKDVYILKMKTSAGVVSYLIWATGTGKTVRFPKGWAIKSVESLTGSVSTYSYNWRGTGSDVVLNPLEPVMLKTN